MFGHALTDEDVLEAFKERRITLPKPPITKKLSQISSIASKLFFGPTRLFQVKKEYMEDMQYDLVRELRKVNGSRDMWSLILDHYKHTMDAGRKYHPDVSIGASIKQSILKALLDGALGKYFITRGVEESIVKIPPVETSYPKNF